ncbi:hypothetical protein ACF0H5_007506 [Mactra antiquata]
MPLKAMLPRRRGATQIDVKSGHVFVITESDDGQLLKKKVFMKVFKNTDTHHVQLFPESDKKNPLGFIRLQKCSLHVNEQAMTISITSKKTILKGLILETRTAKDIHDWMELLSPELKLF